MFRAPDRLKTSYDVVIIGAGGHGLAAAYYLARDHGITNVAVLEKGYIGGGNTGRNTTIIRSNYLTPEGVEFYDECVRLWQDLSRGLRPEPVLLDARPFHAGAHRLGACAPCAGAPRSTSTWASTAKWSDPKEIEASLPAHRPDLRRRTRRSSARSITRRARSRATTRWPGATGAAPTGAASRSTRRPRCSASTSRADRVIGVRTSRGDIATTQGAVRGGGLHAAASPTWSGCARRSTSIRCRPW